MPLKRKNALLSVYNTKGIVKFARLLIDHGWTIYASSGTAKILAAVEIPVIDIATLVGPPILGHRVVTLSREIHAGILARNTPEDLAELTRLGVPWFEIVYVDLYPLEKEIENPDATLESVLEKTDIGGPTMLRAAAKGRRWVISDEITRRIVELAVRDDNQGPLASFENPIDNDEMAFRSLLAQRAEARVAAYCLASANYAMRSALQIGLDGSSDEECECEHHPAGATL